jgi:hypothetical protein
MFAILDGYLPVHGGDSVLATNRRFEFHKRGQQFLRTHNETLSVVAVCVSNPNRSPFTIHR